MNKFNQKSVKPSKKQGSKKNFKHVKNLSRGELNHLKYTTK